MNSSFSLRLSRRADRARRLVALAADLLRNRMSAENATRAHRFLTSVGYTGSAAEADVLRTFARSGYTFDDFLAGLAFLRAFVPGVPQPTTDEVSAPLGTVARAALADAAQKAAIPGMDDLLAGSDGAFLERVLFGPLTLAVSGADSSAQQAADILKVTGAGAALVPVAFPLPEGRARALAALVQVRASLAGAGMNLPPLTVAVVLRDPIEVCAEEFVRVNGEAATVAPFEEGLRAAVANPAATPLGPALARAADGATFLAEVSRFFGLENPPAVEIGAKGFSEWSHGPVRFFAARLESLHLLALHLKREHAAPELPGWLTPPPAIPAGWAGLRDLCLDADLLDRVAARCTGPVLPESERAEWRQKWSSPPPSRADIVYVFPHIPKTAGSSVAHHFREHLAGYGEYVHVRHLADEAGILRDHSLPFQWRDARLRSRARVVFGHAVQRAFCGAIPGKTAREIITLREPAERMVSHYNFWMHVHERRGLPVISFDEWYANEPRDYQVFWIAHNYLGIDYWLYSPETLHDIVDGVLEEFWMVSTLKTFDQDMSLLMRELGLPEISERKNVGGGDRFKKLISLTDDLRARLQRENPLEYRLYEKWLARSRARHGA